MLDSRDRKKIEEYIEKIISKLKAGADKELQRGVANKEVLEHLVNATVGKMTPESKSIMSSVYNMMMEHTLAKEIYQDPEKQAVYYEANILKELSDKFNFEVPSHIDYYESKKILNKWTKAGIVTVTGGVISISFKSWIPVGIAVIIAALMALLLEDKKEASENIHSVIDKYLENVKQTLMDWISDIEKYYDERVSVLEREM